VYHQGSQHLYSVFTFEVFLCQLLSCPSRSGETLPFHALPVRSTSIAPFILPDIVQAAVRGMHASSCLIFCKRCLQLEAQALRVVLQLLPQLRRATRSLPLQQDMLHAALCFVYMAQTRRLLVPYQDMDETSKVSMLCQCACSTLSLQRCQLS